MKRIIPLLAMVATFSGLAVPSASGAAPTVRQITIDEQFTGDFLGIVLLFAGQTLQFTGASKVNEDTGDVLREPRHSLDAQIADVARFGG